MPLSEDRGGRGRAWGLYVAGLGLLVLPLLAAALLGSLAEEPPGKGRHGMVVAVSPPGAEVGRDVLLKGGNAVDAAVATAFAMAVTYPEAGNIGGGGFMVVYPADGREPVVIDYREVAPAAASKTMFRKSDSVYSHKAVGVPKGLAPQAPPDNVLLMPAPLWRELFAPQKEARPESVRQQLHIGVDRAQLPGDPGDSAEEYGPAGEHGADHADHDYPPAPGLGPASAPSANGAGSAPAADGCDSVGVTTSPNIADQGRKSHYWNTLHFNQTRVTVARAPAERTAAP